MNDSEQVLDFSPEPREDPTRSLVVELIVRQALAGEDWRQKSATLVEQHKIAEEEIEQEATRRRDRRTGQSEQGAQRRARVLSEVLRDLPADTPRDQIVEEFRNRFSQPDRRRSRDRASEITPAPVAQSAPGESAAEIAEPASVQPNSNEPIAEIALDNVSSRETVESAATQTEFAPSADQPLPPAALSEAEEIKEKESKKPWWKHVMFWIK